MELAFLDHWMEKGALSWHAWLRQIENTKMGPFLSVKIDVIGVNGLGLALWILG